jgi:3-oxoisoapionate decarboxylase
MNRRNFLFSSAAALAAASQSRAAGRVTSMGIASTSFMAARRPKDAYEFLEYCHALGAGGTQIGMAGASMKYARKLRTRAEELGMYFEVMAPLPREDAAFESAVKAAKEAGALCVRSAALSGRRYETFNSLNEWKKFVSDSHARIERGLRIAERNKMPFGLENHKDWITDEFVALLKKYDSEYLGVCADTGNNLSLLDDPYELVERLAPYAISTHIKDMGLDEYPEGFLLSEVVFGEGMLDLKRIIGMIRAARPNTKFTLEMISRDPLRVPVLTDKYWETFPDRNGRYLARTLALVRDKKAKGGLPTVSQLDAAGKLAVEEENVRKCLAYARDHLGLA